MPDVLMEKILSHSHRAFLIVHFFAIAMLRVHVMMIRNVLGEIILSVMNRLMKAGIKVFHMKFFH